MLAIFRSNQIATAIPLAIYAALLHLPALLGWVQPEPQLARDSGILYQILCAPLEQNALGSAICTLVLVFAQALAINFICNSTRLMGERNWLPGMAYVLIASCTGSFLFLSPPLVAITFIPIAWARVFQAYKTPDALAVVFDAALWVAVAGLFYPPIIWLAGAAYIGINMLRSFKPSEQILFFFGVFTPGFLAWVIYFWLDRGSAFWSAHLWNLFQWWDFNLDLSLKTVLESGVLALFLVIVLFGYGVLQHKKLIQIQKYISTLYWIIFIGCASVLLRNQPEATHFLITAPAAGILLGMTFHNMRSRFIGELLHVAFLGAIFLIYFLN